jgi:hypothetical protein
MMIRKINVFSRGFAVLLLLCGFFDATAGERIIFSKPDSEVVKPTTPENPRSPEMKERVGFSLPGPSQSIAPYLPAQPPMRPERRKTEGRTLLDEPEIFSDPFAHKTREASLIDRSSAGNSASAKPFRLPGAGREEDRALAPIKQYDWTPDETEQDKALHTRDQRLPFESGLFGTRGENEVSARQDSGLGFLHETSTRNSLKERLERQAAFDQLMNPAPSAAIGVRGPERGNMSLMSPLDTPRSPATFVAPSIPDAAPRPSLDPMHAFNEQQRRLSGPTVDDLNRKVFGATESKRSSTIDKADQRTPLMRQPTFQTFPSRDF